MEVSFYLKRPKAENSTILAKVWYEGRVLRYYLAEKIPCVFWNKVTQRAHKTNKDFPEHPEFNARMDTLEHTIKTVYRRYRNDNNNIIPEPETLKALLDIATGKKVTTRPTFLTYFDNFITRAQDGTRISPKTKNSTSPDTNKGYLTTYNHLIEFQKSYKRKIDFDTVDIRFHGDYTAHLTHAKQLAVNTIGDHIKRIITVMRDAKSNGIKVCEDFESDYFFKPHEETDSIYLSEEDLKALADHDLSNDPRLDRARDLFLIGCHTGLRFSDFSRLSPEHIDDNFINIRQQKTGGRIVIPIHPAIKDLQRKYNNSFPKAISNQKINQYIKEVCRQIERLQTSVTITYTKAGKKIVETWPKCELVTSHTARRSFATNEYLAGTPVLTIMAITGHRTEKAFMRYIKLGTTEHAQLLQKHWESRIKV
ncbi:Phage integrase SAM-like domain-containing protein [Chitinophaga jiangningensis]|uniref:Phage integrase SAM-like domain-containing protein n=1 Tax=Chitinophaga jiangningensis TaxID=1419482 RepID=A0A1M7HD79_9BACT|nr:site-specific integrase [Chitinophaga jiangningensis]SHM26491.1 Phage integrase SAM-like domain-containing protein [Chitinophaga jiangningensis]